MRQFVSRDAPNRESRARMACGAEPGFEASFSQGPPQTEDVENEKSRSGSVVRSYAVGGAGTGPAATCFGLARQFSSNQFAVGRFTTGNALRRNRHRQGSLAI